MPFVSVLKRETIKKYFLRNFRQAEQHREDAAQLLSLNELVEILDDKFEVKLNTRYSVQQLLAGNKGIVWSDFHLNLLGLVKQLHLNDLILSFAKDEANLTNNYLNPTFYLLLKKK